MAAGRAVGAREPDPSARNPDYLAEKLLGDPSKLDVDHPAVRALGLGYDEKMKDVEVVSNVRMMTIRTRFIDDALERAIAGGATQVVILGAGFEKPSSSKAHNLITVAPTRIEFAPMRAGVRSHWSASPVPATGPRCDGAVGRVTLGSRLSEPGGAQPRGSPGPSRAVRRSWSVASTGTRVLTTSDRRVRERRPHRRVP